MLCWVACVGPQPRAPLFEVPGDDASARRTLRTFAAAQSTELSCTVCGLSRDFHLVDNAHVVVHPDGVVPRPAAAAAAATAARDVAIDVDEPGPNCSCTFVSCIRKKNVRQFSWAYLFYPLPSFLVVDWAQVVRTLHPPQSPWL